MKEFNFTIKDELGIHARPAGLLVKQAKAFDSKIMIKKDGKEADASKLFSVMGLGVKKGDEVTITAEGADEDTVINALEEFFNANL